jgi:hypothetical protein
MLILRAEYWASSRFDRQLLRPCTGGLPFGHQLPAQILFVDATNIANSLSANLFRYRRFNVVEPQVWIQTHVRGRPPALLQTCGPCVVCRQGDKSCSTGPSEHGQPIIFSQKFPKLPSLSPASAKVCACRTSHCGTLIGAFLGPYWDERQSQPPGSYHPIAQSCSCAIAPCS